MFIKESDKFITTVIITTVKMMNQGEQHWQLFATISGIYIKSRRIAEEQLKPLKVTWPQFGALFNLNQEDNITQTQLAERMEADVNTTMVLCNSLERKGWITRNRDPSDKRVNLLSITTEGRAIFQIALPLILQDYTVFTEAISTENIQLIMPILRDLYSKVNERYLEVKK